MSDIYQQPEQIPSSQEPETKFFCPVSGCDNEMDTSTLEKFECSRCETGFTLKVIDDVVIPSVRRRGMDGFIEVVSMPELPSKREERFVDSHGLDAEQASKLTTTMETADFYESLADNVSKEVAASFVADTLLGELHYRDMSIETVQDEEVVDLVSDVESDTITWKSVVEVVREALDSNEKIDDVYADKDLEKVDSSKLESVVENVIEEETDAVQDYTDGEDGAMNYLVGQVMSRTGGKADAEETRELISSKL